MIKTTIWRPDTCDCIVEYTWDNETTEDNRVHTFKNVVRRCSAHDSVSHGKPVYDKVLSENDHKNKTLHEVSRQHKALHIETKDANGNVVGHIPDLENIGWSFDANRRLKIHIKTNKLSLVEKNKIKADVAKVVDATKFDIE